jgi:hypothetical protein
MRQHCLLFFITVSFFKAIRIHDKTILL